MTSLNQQRKNELKREYKEKRKQMGVYRIANLANGKVLVGCSRNLDSLFNRFRFELKRGCHRNQELQYDWNHFGPELFRFEIVELLKDDGQNFSDLLQKLKEMEARWLEKLKPYHEKGYNPIPDK